MSRAFLRIFGLSSLLLARSVFAQPDSPTPDSPPGVENAPVDGDDPDTSEPATPIEETNPDTDPDPEMTESATEPLPRK